MKTIKTLFMGIIVALVAFSFSACNSEIPAGNPLKGSWKSLDGTTTYTFDKDGYVTYYKHTETSEENTWTDREYYKEEETTLKGTYFLTKESVVINYTYRKYSFDEKTWNPDSGYRGEWEYNSGDEEDNEHSSSETFAYVIDGDQLLLGDRGASGAISGGKIYNKQ